MPFKSVKRGGPGLLRSQRSQSWSHGLDELENAHTIDFQYAGNDPTSNQAPSILSPSPSKGTRSTAIKLPAPPGRGKVAVDIFIVVVFCLMMLHFYSGPSNGKHGFAFQRKVCPKIVHGLNSSYELYHARKGPVVDGVSRTLNRLVNDLQRRGYRVLVLAPYADPPALEHYGMLMPVPAFSIPFRPEYSLASGLDYCTREALAAHNPSFVHLASPDYLGKEVQKWAMEHNLPIGCSYHTRFASYLPYYVGTGSVLSVFDGGLWRWLSYFYNNCDQVYPPTERVGQEITDHGVQTPMKIWPRGIDLTAFNVDYRSDDVRTAWGVQPNEVVVLFASRMVWEKNVRVYIDTMNYLIEQKVPVRPLVVGAGPALAKVREELKTAIILGHQGGRNLSTAFASSDIFFFPSTTETWGNVALEAMASGTTVVCAKGPGGSELVVHNKTGFLVNVNDPEDCTKGIQMLVEDSALRKRLATEALSIIKSEQAYNWQHVTDMLVGHYNELS